MFQTAVKNFLRILPFFLVVACILGVIGYLAWLNHNDFEKAMVKQAHDRLTDIARSEAQSIEEYVGDVDQELDILSSERLIFNILNKESGSQIKYHSLLEDSYKDIKELVDSIYLIDAGGIVIDAAPLKEGLIGRDLSQAPDVNRMLSAHKTFICGIFGTTPDIKVLSDLHPVFDNGKFIGLLRAVISVEKIDNLLGHINSQRKIYAFVIDAGSVILSSPNKDDIGKPFPALLKAKLPGSIIASVPIRVGDARWTILVGMDYSVIARPINRNARDNLAFVGFVLFILGVIGAIFYRAEKKRAELAISKMALDLINKQLHLEIEKRREIEKKLTECVRKGSS